MSVVTQPNIGLVLTLDSTEVACQIIDLSFKPPGVGSSTITETACPDGRVSEPGAVTPGALTGNVFTDSQDSGITWLLAQAYETDATMTYTLTFFDELGTTVAMQYSGDAKVATFQLDFSKPGNSKHPIDLEIVSAVLARPVVSAA